MYLQIECTHYQALVSAKKLNLATMHMDCNRCGQKVPFAEKPLVNLSQKFKPPLPPGIHIEKEQDRLKIQILCQNNWIQNKDTKSFSKQQFTFLGIIVLFTSIFIQASILIYPFALLTFLLAFYYFTYRPFALHNPPIEIIVNRRFLEINYGRWPHFLAFGKRKFPVTDIQQLYIRKSKKKRHQDQRCYALSAVLKNRKTSVLIEPLISPELALFLEQEIEHFLKIKDEPVMGEIR